MKKTVVCNKKKNSMVSPFKNPFVEILMSVAHEIDLKICELKCDFLLNATNKSAYLTPV